MKGVVVNSLVFFKQQVAAHYFRSSDIVWFGDVNWMRRWHQGTCCSYFVEACNLNAVQCKVSNLHILKMPPNARTYMPVYEIVTLGNRLMSTNAELKTIWDKLVRVLTTAYRVIFMFCLLPVA